PLAPKCERASVGCNRCLVDQLNCKLELSTRECIGDLTKVLGAEVSADAAAVLVTFELGVVKEVEALRTELHMEALRKRKALEQRQVKVVASGAANGVETQVAKAVCTHSAGWL